LFQELHVICKKVLNPYFESLKPYSCPDIIFQLSHNEPNFLKRKYAQNLFWLLEILFCADFLVCDMGNIG
jgi:hypothetical protein